MNKGGTFYMINEFVITISQNVFNDDLDKVLLHNNILDTQYNRNRIIDFYIKDFLNKNGIFVDTTDSISIRNNIKSRHLESIIFKYLIGNFKIHKIRTEIHSFCFFVHITRERN